MLGSTGKYVVTQLMIEDDLNAQDVSSAVKVNI